MSGWNGHGTAPASASEKARIQGGGLVQLIVTGVQPLSYYLFLNGAEVLQEEVESLAVHIEVPSDDAGEPIVYATLTRMVQTVNGGKNMQAQELFPCVIDMVALERRVQVIVSKAGSLDGLWVQVGMKPDGSGSELHGLQAITILLDGTILHAEVTWTDGKTEKILPA